MIRPLDSPTEAWMRAVESRDARFDGWVIVGVTSTGIYCRPSCPTPVRPKRANMRFFSTPAAAQAEGFRACKRCAPDATPGSPEWNRRDDLVARAVRAIEDGFVDRVGVDGLAAELGVSSRHLHRTMVAELGATPIELARARRARTARILVDATDLPFGEVAFAAGFSSIRQFNDTIRQVFAASPTELRRSRRRRGPGGRGRHRHGDRGPADDASVAAITLRLAYRPPLAVEQIGAWIAAHAIEGVESFDDGVVRRSLRLPHGAGVVEVDLGAARDRRAGALPATFHLASARDLHAAMQRTRRLLDLDADPAVIRADLATDRVIRPLLDAEAGVRSVADVDPFDAAIRAVIHQQVSVASASSTLGRLARAHGEPLPTPIGNIDRLLPGPEVWADLDAEGLGLPATRARTVVDLARAVVDGVVDLSGVADRADALAALGALRGIGPWTCGVVALRGFADPDAFLPGDLVLERQARLLGLSTDAEPLVVRAERWRPWRAYAMHHLWNAHRRSHITNAGVT